MSTLFNIPRSVSIFDVDIHLSHRFNHIIMGKQELQPHNSALQPYPANHASHTKAGKACSCHVTTLFQTPVQKRSDRVSDGRAEKKQRKEGRVAILCGCHGPLPAYFCRAPCHIHPSDFHMERRGRNQRRGLTSCFLSLPSTTKVR